MPNKAVLIGNSDGIGLATTRELLRRGWKVVGISRSKSRIDDPSYDHFITSVQDVEYPVQLNSILKTGEPVDLCIYCAGIGERLDLSDMKREAEVMDVNLLGMVKTASLLIPFMVKRKKGHFIGLSSVSDELLSAEAPSYHASKAGFSNYLEGLALALRPEGVHVTNLRFGFVDTKMAKGNVKPFMIGVDKAVHHLLRCIDKKPVRYTAPKIVIPLVSFRRWMMKLSLLVKKPPV